jgi:hypothetical protein
VNSRTEVSKLPGRQPVSVAAAVALARQREQVPAALERLEEQWAVLAQAHQPAQRPLSRSTARSSTWWLERPERAQPPER